jgi:ferredoxin
MTDDANWMPRIARSVCIGCGECIALCPTSALGQRKGKADLIYPDRCTYCAACESVCPVNAIELPYLVVLVNSSHREKS